MAPRRTTQDVLLTALLSLGVFGFLSELVGAALGDAADRHLVGLGLLLVLGSGSGYLRLWVRVVGRRLWQRWTR